MEERKGALTKEQENILDELLKFNNKALEAVDGAAISLIDNQGIDRIINMLKEKHPGAEEYIYQVVDLLFIGLQQLITEE